MKIASWIVGAAIVIGLAVLGIRWQLWIYHECRQVGHSKTYCFFKKY